MEQTPESWRDELLRVDRTLRAMSAETDPEEVINIFWESMGPLRQFKEYLAVSLRDVERPTVVVTRSSRFEVEYNPFTQRDLLPRVDRGLLSELAYTDGPVVIEDLASRLTPDDPAHFYLHGVQSLISIPQYNDGQKTHVGFMLITPEMNFDWSRVPMLAWNSGLFGRGTSNLVLRNQLSAALAALDRELQTVGQIQRSLLPDSLPKIDGFQLAAFYDTSARAGGDYYDFFPLDGGKRWGILIADVSGHGTPAAVVMAVLHAIAHEKQPDHASPSRLLSNVSAALARCYTNGRMFVTAFYAILDPAKKTLTYARAGHNPPRLMRDGKIIELNEVGDLPLGILDITPEYHETTIDLKPNDLLLFYTDGITEHAAPTREQFGVARLDELLLNCHGSPDDCIADIRAAVTAFAPGPAQDDQTLLAIRCAFQEL